MSDVFDELGLWYAAQCDGDWEHEFGIDIKSLDNPGWLVEIDLTGTLLEDEHLEPSEIENAAKGIWLSCYVRENRFVGAGDPARLRAIIGTFVEWAKSRSDWLSQQACTDEEIQAREDKEFLAIIGEETGPKTCRKEGCDRLRVTMSVFCREHHFEQIRGCKPK